MNTAYEIEPPSGEERGIRVVCRTHDEATEFQPGQSGGAFYCPGCGVELDVTLTDPDDWRDWGERC